MVVAPAYVIGAQGDQGQARAFVLRGREPLVLGSTETTEVAHGHAFSRVVCGLQRPIDVSEKLDPARFPHLERLGAALASCNFTTEYGRGLEILIASVRIAVRTPRSRLQSP